ncbi:helix-turn-helix domain-containing protein [Agriterribacter sp.]|uniref:helix-turn-helix domain-containing protein n=1 Tax=Agriterribacter sp. TaxID=2821509 RepID=UPI002C7687FC|nr:helix-turn-helix domain-containing protein [Agriterribacter sp.]HRO46429.1 helix-turn-helix domain-containing protein [Agriterribacter sp.]HRQ17617.1 helix-turn-helix domain-containing protein [Agriterribacter sp.]
MTSFDASNVHFQRALQFVNQTGRHIFLTGRAGTGKTTFLRYIRDNCFKKMAVVAPTGVAAINAGGTTLHSFFQLPFGPYLPTHHAAAGETQVTNEHTLFRNLKFSSSKRELLQELELLVIDEVSMMRADTLDAIDIILRHYRRQLLVPFGGVQVLYIGDLFQLPPVINNAEWEILQSVYKSPFFFDALVIQQNPPVYIELKKIYRQNEADFIQILNNVRNNNTTAADLERLHQYYKPGFEPPKEENFIVLTTHNARADQINRQELEKLPGKSSAFTGELTGDFNERALPAEKILRLKPGAQIMFTKNDKGEVRRYYNGKIGMISRIAGDKIYVKFPGDDNELLLEKETWKNIRYNYNKEKDNIEEEELGAFTQYPLRLAWAITIHKSQGLTFTKAIIDAGASFAPGQVYVALSRLTALNGLVLYSRIHPQCIHTDPRVLTFAQSEMDDEEMQEQLQQEQKRFVTFSLTHAFNFIKLTQNISIHYEAYAHRQIPDKNTAIQWAQSLVALAQSQLEVSDKFNKQLTALITEAEANGFTKLHERVTAAFAYFTQSLEKMLASLKQHANEMKVKKKVKKYLKELRSIELDITRKKQQIAQAVQLSEGLLKGTQLSDLLQLAEMQKKPATVEETIAAAETSITAKAKKGDTQRMSLELFMEGKSIAEIAQLRELTTGTIEGHLSRFIPTGEIKITDILSEEKIAAICKAIEETGAGFATSPVKEKLGDAYSHGEIRAVITYLNAGEPVKG